MISSLFLFAWVKVCLFIIVQWSLGFLVVCEFQRFILQECPNIVKSFGDFPILSIFSSFSPIEVSQNVPYLTYDSFAFFRCNGLTLVSIFFFNVDCGSKVVKACCIETKEY